MYRLYAGMITDTCTTSVSNTLFFALFPISQYVRAIRRYAYTTVVSILVPFPSWAILTQEEQPATAR